VGREKARGGGRGAGDKGGKGTKEESTGSNLKKCVAGLGRDYRGKKNGKGRLGGKSGQRTGYYLWSRAREKRGGGEALGKKKREARSSGVKRARGKKGFGGKKPTLTQGELQKVRGGQ